MKTKKLLHSLGFLGVIASVTAFAPLANATGKEAKDQKSYTGMITAVDAKDHTVNVHGFLFSKDFVLADDCALATGDNTKASLTDFRPGQKVEVRYRDASGVLIAEHINQKQMRFSGTVAAIDQNQHALTVHQRGMNRTFVLGKDCDILRNGKSDEKMANVKWGDRVTVVYELPNDRRVAREINLPGVVFTGSLNAIDLGDRTINAGKHSRKGRTFRLADNCVIIANGKADGSMSDLRLGRDYELNYESVDGINVVDRIAPAKTTAKHEGSTPMVQYEPVY